MKYYAALEKVQTGDDKSDFILLVIDVVKDSLERYLSILK